MGVLLSYATVEPVSADVRAELLNECQSLVAGQDWWCESMWLSEEPGENGELIGWNKIFLITYTDDDGSYVEVDGAAECLMAYRDTRFIVEPLCRWSRRYTLTWIV